MNLEAYAPVPDLTRITSLLAIQPHPDDNEVGAGATLSWLADRGVSITYLTVTDGAAGTEDPATRPWELAATRRREALEAARIVGASQEALFLDYADGSLERGSRALRISMLRAIRAVRPQAVLTVDPHLPDESHPDHKATGLAVMEAACLSGYPLIEPETGPAWSVQAVVLSMTGADRANTFLDVSATWERKRRALAAHASQFPPPVLEPMFAFMTEWARALGRAHGVAMAEPLRVLSPRHLHVYPGPAPQG